MQEKAKTERELRQQELDLRRLEQQQNQQVMVTVLQQQQQTNQAILSVIQKLIEKKEKYEHVKSVFIYRGIVGIVEGFLVLGRATDWNLS